LVCQPTQCHSCLFAQKILTVNPPKKKNFCVLCLKLANFFMIAPPTNSGRYANVPDLLIALVAATVLAHPVVLTRSYPLTHTQCWGGFLRQLRPLPRWREQPHLVAQWCHHLRPSRRHPLLPPSYTLPSVARYFYLQGEGPPIHFVLVIHHHRSRSAHDASTNLVVLADVMAPGLPIHRSTFFVGGVIGPVLPINNQSIWNGWA
jgi:hypothetical protein